MSYLPRLFAALPTFTPEDLEQEVRFAARLEALGYTFEDALAYMRCTEEVSPDLAEDVALRRMAAIAKRYPQGNKAKLDTDYAALEAKVVAYMLEHGPAAVTLPPGTYPTSVTGVDTVADKLRLTLQIHPGDKAPPIPTSITLPFAP